MSSVCQRNFQTSILEVPDDPIIEQPPMLLFGDFLNSAVPKESRIYQEIPDINKLMIVLKVGSIEMKLKLLEKKNLR